MKIGAAFQFMPPEGWYESGEGSRHIFRSPKDEALIVSGYSVSGSPKADRNEACKQLFVNVCNEISKAASDPALREIAPLDRRREFEKLEVWSQHSITTDSVEAFSQAVVISDRGVLFITLKSFAAGVHMQIFRSVVSSVSKIPES